MSTKRLALITGAAGTAVLVLVVLVVLAFRFAPESTEASPTPSPTATRVASPSPTASSAPIPTATLPATVVATCDNTSTAEFRAITATSGWVSWTKEVTGRDVSPFKGFPDGAPEGELACTWGADPSLGTDNVYSLAWAPIDPENAVAAMQSLEASGYTRIDTPEGVYLAMRGDGSGPLSPGVDSEGYAQAYLFTYDDVRWAAYKDEVRYVKAPTQPD